MIAIQAFFLIVLWFFLLVLCIAMFILIIRIQGEIFYVDKLLDVYLRVFFFRFHVFSSTKNLEKDEKRREREERRREKAALRNAKRKKPKPEKVPKPKKPTPKFDFDLNRDLETVLHLLSQLRDVLRIERLHVNVVIATNDAATTGVLLGSASALVGIILPFLDSTFIIRDKKIYIDGDFYSANWKNDVELLISTRLYRSLFVFIRNYKTILEFIPRKEATV